MTFDDRRKLSIDAAFALGACEPIDAAQLVCAFLEDQFEYPLPSFFDLHGTASIWAASATPIELEAYLGAVLNALGRTASHVNQRKRLVAMLWKDFAAQDQEAFLEWVAKNRSVAA